MIPITKPFFDECEAKAVAESLRSGWVAQGPKVREFEEAVAALHKVRHAIAVTSCTSALHIILETLGVGPGDEVVVPAYTFIASANAVEYTGAKPVFCDIDPVTCNVDVADMAAKITSATKAIMPVHLFGLCADIEAVINLAREKKIAVVEDAACALAAECNGRFAGSFGAAGAVSFHPRKIMTTGEGGMVLTDNDEMATTLRSLRDHGASTTDLARHSGKAGFLLPQYKRVGYNYRMTDIQGTIGVEQMKKLPRIIKHRRSLAARYDEMLRDITWLRPVTAPQGYAHSYQTYACRMLEGAPMERDEIIEAMKSRGIACRQGTHAVHIQDYYARKYGLKPGDFPESLAADRGILALPLYNTMPENEQDIVVAALADL